MSSQDSCGGCGVLVGERPVLLEVWSRCCHRLGLVPMNSVDVHECDDVAVVLLDAGTGADIRSSSPIVLLIDQPSASQVLAQPTGVKAVISWHDGALELEAATRAVLDGHCHISATAATAVLAALATTRTATPNSVNRLTVREIDVLRAMVDGATIRSTARALGIAVKTVEAHRASAFVKLGVRTQAQAIAHLVRNQTVLSSGGK